MIITITILLFSHIHVRHIEPNWSWTRFTLVANRTVNVFAVHWTGRVKITTVPNQTEPNRTGTGQNHAFCLRSLLYDLLRQYYDEVTTNLWRFYDYLMIFPNRAPAYNGLTSGCKYSAMTRFTQESIEPSVIITYKKQFA